LHVNTAKPRPSRYCSRRGPVSRDRRSSSGALLRPPSGFEGLRAVREPQLTENPSPAERPYPPVVELGLNTARLSPYGLPESGHETVANSATRSRGTQPAAPRHDLRGVHLAQTDLFDLGGPTTRR